METLNRFFIVTRACARARKYSSNVCTQLHQPSKKDARARAVLKCLYFYISFDLHALLEVSEFCATRLVSFHVIYMNHKFIITYLCSAGIYVVDVCGNVSGTH